MGGIHSPTALLSMISCALVLAAMIVFGLAERAPLKKLRMKLMVGESGVLIVEVAWMWYAGKDNIVVGGVVLLPD